MKKKAYSSYQESADAATRQQREKAVYSDSQFMA